MPNAVENSDSNADRALGSLTYSQELIDHGIVVVPLEDEAFAVAADCGLVLHLNSTARLIVERTVRGDKAHEIAERLAGPALLDPALVLEDVQSLISDICNKCRVAKETPPTDYKPAQPLDQPIDRGIFRIFGKRIRVEYINQEIAAVFHPVLAPFNETADEAPDLTVTIDDTGKSYLVNCGAAAITVDRTPRAAFSGLMRVLVFHDRPDDTRKSRVLLHAGSVVGSRGAWLVGGHSGRGKSSLLTKLDYSGKTVLSDDLAPVDLSKRLVFPYPKALSVKEHGWDNVARFRPDLFDSEARITPVGKHVRYMAPLNPPQDRDRRGHAICGLLLPNRTPGADPEIKNVSPKDAMLALCDKYGRFPIKSDGLSALISIVEEIPRFELTYDDADDILPELVKLL